MGRKRKGKGKVKKCWQSGGMNNKGDPCLQPATSPEGRCKHHNELDDRIWPEIEVPKARGFLFDLSRNGNVAQACRRLGISTRRVHRWREDEVFERAYQEAKQMSADELERVARRLATGKTRKYKFTGMGDPIMHPDRPGEHYYEEVYDTGMLKFLHKIIRPEAHREQIDIRSIGLNLADLPDDGLERLMNGEDLFTVVADLLRRLKQLDEHMITNAEVTHVDGVPVVGTLPAPSGNGSNGDGS